MTRSEVIVPFTTVNVSAPRIGSSRPSQPTSYSTRTSLPISVIFDTSYTSGLAGGNYFAVFLVGMFLAFARAKRTVNNPWGEGATTLEWTLPSPPAFHSYETLPQIEATEHH